MRATFSCFVTLDKDFFGIKKKNIYHTIKGMLESARLLEGMGPCAGTAVLRVLLSLHRLWRGLTHSVLTTW